jgi:hypothetical protein
MNKKRIVLSGIFYPMAILSFFRRALERRNDIELITTGPYTGNWIPWAGGMELDQRYAIAPTHPLGTSLIGLGSIPAPFIPDVDLWIQCDAGFYFLPRPQAKHVVHIATDPHVLKYDRQRTICDHFFNMQKAYSQPGDIYLPYACDPILHAPLELEKVYDGCLIGLQYQNRNELVSALHARGHKICYKLGVVFDVYQQVYCQSRVALVWSSLNDLIARVFEGMAMGLPVVCNRVPDLPDHFVEGTHYLGFDTVSEAVKQFEWVLEHPVEASLIAQTASKLVLEKHTYDVRVQQIFDIVFKGE